jgi:hypothetical protein
MRAKKKKNTRSSGRFPKILAVRFGMEKNRRKTEKDVVTKIHGSEELRKPFFFFFHLREK